ncbi:unnamed protein product [Meloidogyne enterolobii]|uniref:Uncharacterized protein n=1 Tax=Meloidogyne enterolobii TaxID=390850 RepID=A0ACB1AS18_MELEN
MVILSPFFYVFFLLLPLKMHFFYSREGWNFCEEFSFWFLIIDSSRDYLVFKLGREFLSF